jgi:adenine/guanine phosphoribosyltransferase-like PRPP-binding protein
LSLNILSPVAWSKFKKTWYNINVRFGTIYKRETLLNTELPAGETEEKIIHKKEEILLGCFRKSAKVIDYEEGYISVPFVNQLIDPKLQGYAADIIAYNIKINEIKIDKIIQIPYSGNSLATSVAERTGLPLVLGRKGEKTPGSWHQPIFIDEDIQSFTTEGSERIVFNGLEVGDSTYIIDDVIALGNTAPPIINGLRAQGIEVNGMAVYFAKLFQPGMEVIQRETEIEPFVVIGIEDLNSGGEILYSFPHF